MKSKSLKIVGLVLALILALGMTLACISGGTAVFADIEGEQPTLKTQTRVYERHLDRLINDLKSDNRVEPAYHAVQWQEGYCASPSEPIFKIGSGVFNTGGVDSIHITLRSPDESVLLEDLGIAFRHNLHDQDADLRLYPMFELMEEDIVSLSAGEDITSEWVTLTLELISADLFNECEEKIGLGAGAPDILTGIHLYCDTQIEGRLDIQSVEFSPQKGQRQTIIAFDEPMGTAASIKKYGYWWAGTQERWDAGSDSPQAAWTTVPAQFVMKTAQKIVADPKADVVGNVDEAYSAVVINMKTYGGVTVAPIDEKGNLLAGKNLSELTDLKGEKWTDLPDDEFFGAVISLDSLGYKKITGVQITPESGKSVILQSVFLTNMDELTRDPAFPKLDTENKAYLSDFDFEYKAVGGNYDAAVADCAKFGLDYILSYSDKTGTVENGHLVMECGKADFVQMKVRSKIASEGKRYVVIKYRLENGATLDKFRFGVIDAAADSTSSPVLTEDLYCGTLHRSMEQDNPYTAAGDYLYLIVDLYWTFDAEDSIAGVDLYYTGAGRMMIDEIYYIGGLENGENVSYETINANLPAYDDAKPVLTVQDGVGATGEAVTLAATAYDYTDGDNVKISYKVTFGVDNVTVTNGTFTPYKAGTYFVTVTAEDGAGNAAESTYRIVVTGEDKTDPGDTPEKPEDSAKGLSGGAIAGIVIGGIAAVGIVAAVVVVLFKKRNK